MSVPLSWDWIDETLIFDRLRRDEIGEIVVLQLERVKKRLAKQGLHLELSEQAIEFLENQGDDPVYGARPLKRAIQKHLLDSLSMEVLKGKFSEGDHIKVAVENGALVFA